MYVSPDSFLAFILYLPWDEDPIYAFKLLSLQYNLGTRVPGVYIAQIRYLVIFMTGFLQSYCSINE